MKYKIILACALGVIFSYAQAKDTESNPVISPYGKIYPSPNALFQPHKSIAEHKILFNLSKPASTPKALNPSLDKVARMINLYASAGINPQQLKIFVIVHGDATPILLDNARYKEIFGINNPNSELLAKLKELGVGIGVCAQAWEKLEYKPEWLDKNAIITLSALTTLVYLQQQGYALVPL